MNNRKLQVAVAALALGVQLASPAAAGIRPLDLSALTTAVATGEAAQLDAVLGQNPHLAQAVARVGENEGLTVLVKGGNDNRGNGNGNGRGNDRGRSDDNRGRGHDQGRGHDGSRGNHGGHGGHGGIY